MGDDEKQVLFNNQKKESNSHGKDDGLMSFRSCLRWMCVDQSNPWWASLSWLLFFLLAIIVPTVSHFWLACADCDAKLHRPYDAVLQLSLTSIATVSFLCLSKFVRKYGLRRFLYLDKLCDESEKVRQGYTAQLHRSLKILAFFVLPCFALEAAYKIWWYSSGASQIPFLGNVYLSDAIACILELSSWLYRTSIFFLVCVLFRLICYLQILRLQDFAQVFQEESDVASVLKEHLRIRRHLRVISHRYRAFILSALIIITASQFASLFNTTRFHDVSLYRTGELASSSLPISKTFVLRKKWLCSYHPRMLCSLTMMAGLFILLRGATKITHKAQSVTCLAAKWHICATLDSFDGTDSETPMTQIISHERLFSMNLGGESDDDDAGDEDDDINTTKFFMPAFAHTISFQKRQALVTYFENNRAGITVFGFMLDRTYMHTIFGIELSLVLWLLGKTIGIS